MSPLIRQVALLFLIVAVFAGCRTMMCPAGVAPCAQLDNEKHRQRDKEIENEAAAYKAIVDGLEETD